MEYYDDDFYYDDDKVENVSNKNDSLKTENTTSKKKTTIDKKALSKTNDYEYPGKKSIENTTLCVKDCGLHGLKYRYDIFFHVSLVNLILQM